MTSRDQNVQESIAKLGPPCKDRYRFLHALPYPMEGLAPGHADIRVPTSHNGLWRLH